MKKLMYVKQMTPKQYRAKERIEEIERIMRRCKDDDLLFDLYCEADNIWEWNFDMESIMNPDPNFRPLHEDIFNQRHEVLMTRDAMIKSTLVSVNNSTNVTVNITINGKEMR